MRTADDVNFFDLIIDNVVSEFEKTFMFQNVVAEEEIGVLGVKTDVG